MEKRVLAYLDILGFSESIKDSEAEQSIAELINELSSKTQAGGYEQIDNINTPALKLRSYNLSLEVSSFSDCIVISTPQSESNNDSASIQYEWIMKELPPIIYSCLKKGFLTRGAIVYGDVIHEKGKVYGKTFVEAVEHEEKVAIYPRIIFCESLIKAVDNMWDINSKAYRDQDGIYYINWLKNMNFNEERFEPIRKQIISRMKSSKSMKHFAKWAWMANYINKYIKNKNDEIPNHHKALGLKSNLEMINISVFNSEEQ